MSWAEGSTVGHDPRVHRGGGSTATRWTRSASYVDGAWSGGIGALRTSSRRRLRDRVLDRRRLTRAAASSRARAEALITHLSRDRGAHRVMIRPAPRQRAEPRDPRAPRIHPRGSAARGRLRRPATTISASTGSSRPSGRRDRSVRRRDLRPVRHARLRVPAGGLGRMARRLRRDPGGRSRGVPRRLVGDGDRPSDRTGRRHGRARSNARRARRRLAGGVPGRRGARDAGGALPEVVPAPAGRAGDRPRDAASAGCRRR